MLTSDQVAELAEVRGILRAFEWFNSKVNYSPTFTMSELPERPTLHEALQAHFGGDAIEIEMSQVDDWSRALRAVLLKWLFEYRDLVSREGIGCLTDKQAESDLVDEILRRLANAIQPVAARGVRVKTREFYELSWDDLAIETNRGRYLLHLGWTD